MSPVSSPRYSVRERLELTVEEFATVMRTSPLGRHLSANKQNSVKPQPAPRSPPPSAEILKDLASLLVANLDKLVIEATVVPIQRSPE